MTYLVNNGDVIPTAAMQGAPNKTTISSNSPVTINIASNFGTTVKKLDIVNGGSNVITVAMQGGAQIYLFNSGLVNSFTISPNEYAVISKNDGYDDTVTVIKVTGGVSLTRFKSECWFTSLNLNIGTTPVNLINLIKSLTHTGSFAPFFNTTTNKLNVFNQNTSVNFKINVIGSWSGGATNRSMTIDFPQTNGNSLTKTRDASVTTDQISMTTFFSVDQNGNMVTNPTDITIVANGAAFTATAILLIAEQLVQS